MTRFSHPVMTHSHKTEGSAFVILQFEYNILRYLPADHLLQQKPKIVYYVNQRMRTVDDVINGLRAKFDIPFKIEMTVHGGSFLLPDLPAKALTHFSNYARVQLQREEYTTGRTSSSGELELVVPPPTPESHSEEEQESIETINDPASDSGMSDSESDKEADKKKKKLARQAITPGPSKTHSFAEKTRQVKGSDWMAQAEVRTRWNSLTGTALRGLLQSRGMNSSDKSGNKSFPASDYFRRPKRSAQNQYPCEIATAKRKLSFNVTEDQVGSPVKDAEETAEDVVRCIEKAIQPKLAPPKLKPLTWPGSILSRQVDRAPGQLTPWPQQTSRFQHFGKQWFLAEYEDVEPHQIIQLKLKKGDDWKDLGKVVITVVEVQQDCIKGKRATPMNTSEKIEVFARSTIKEIKIMLINGEVATSSKTM